MESIVGTAGYVWVQIYEQQGKKLNEHLDETLKQIAEAGFQAWEQGIESAAHAANLKSLLPKYGLKMPSIYAGGVMHTDGWQKVVEDVVSRARLALAWGAKIVVCNPNPIAWGKSLDKTDEQLKIQAEALQNLSDKLTAEGLAIAYHTHDAEMRCAAREFHHMMQSTNVGFCCDTHWIYRGAGDSQVAMYDALKMYGGRLRSLHVRQSHQGIWSEVFDAGDLDYRPLANELKSNGFNGPIVVEQCFETGTPQTLTPVERHRRSREYVREVFGL
jgi:inosose dehydratase